MTYRIYHIFLSFLFLIIIIISGCVSGHFYITPPDSSKNVENSIIINKSKEELWSGFVPALAKSFFVINNIDKVLAFHLQTENEVLQKITDSSIIIGLITISRNLKNIGKCAVDVSEDLQVKHRPKTTYKRELGTEKLIEPLELL